MTSDSQRRVTFCLFATVANFLLLALPKVGGATFYSIVSIGALLNLIAIWLILKEVKPMVNESEHLKVVAFTRRWIALLVSLLTIFTFVASFSGSIERQAIPFLVFGYVFLLLLPMKILRLAVEKRMREIRNGS